MFTTQAIDCSREAAAAHIARLSQAPSWEFMRAQLDNQPALAGETVAFQYFRYGFGGAEKVTSALIEVFAEMGCRVLLYTDIAPEPGDYPLPDSVERIHVDAPYDKPAQRAAWWREQVAQQGIGTVIYSSWCSPAALLDCLAVKSAGARFVFYVHGSTPFFTQIDDPPLPLRLERVGCNADAVVCLSSSDAVFWRAYNGNVHVVANPVEAYLSDVPTRAQAPAGKTVLWCGRFSFYEKRPDEALYIHQLLLKQHPDARLVFLGGGTEDEDRQLRALAAKLGIAEAVVFTGYQPDPLPFYQIANVFLATSVSEGFPMAISEAMHQGVPIVSYAMPFVQLAHGDGFISVPQLHRQAAADALAQLLADPAEQDRRGKAARATYDEVCKVDFEKLWKGILATLDDQPGGTQDNAQDDAQDDASQLVRNLMYQYRCNVEQRDAARRQDAQETRPLSSQLEAELEQARQALAELEGSTMMKVGRAATAVPRALKDRMQAGQ